MSTYHIIHAPLQRKPHSLLTQSRVLYDAVISELQRLESMLNENRSTFTNLPNFSAQVIAQYDRMTDAYRVAEQARDLLIAEGNATHALLGGAPHTEEDIARAEEIMRCCQEWYSFAEIVVHRSDYRQHILENTRINDVVRQLNANDREYRDILQNDIDVASMQALLSVGRNIGQLLKEITTCLLYCREKWRARQEKLTRSIDPLHINAEIDELLDLYQAITETVQAATALHRRIVATLLFQKTVNRINCLLTKINLLRQADDSAVVFRQITIIKGELEKDVEGLTVYLRPGSTPNSMDEIQTLFRDYKALIELCNVALQDRAEHEERSALTLHN